MCVCVCVEKVSVLFRVDILILFTSQNQTFYHLFKVRHVSGCINHDTKLASCRAIMLIHLVATGIEPTTSRTKISAVTTRP